MISQEQQMEDESNIIFAPESEKDTEDSSSLLSSNQSSAKRWKILIVDDEPDIHEVTQLSLKAFEFAGSGLQFLNAYSSLQAKDVISKHADIAVILVDIVMETEHAGLELIKYIREQLNNKIVRIVIRTGQPGQAPQKDVIHDYDINDYKEKTELTALNLYTTIYTSLRSYRDTLAIETNRQGLKHIIHASASLFTTPNIDKFIQGVLKQLSSLLSDGDNAIYIRCECITENNDKDNYSILAAFGHFSKMIGKDPLEVLPTTIIDSIKQAHTDKKSILNDKEFIGYLEPQPSREDIIYINSQETINHDDIELLELFLHNTSIAYKNIMLRNEIDGTQRDILYMLGDSVETRSKETGQHVRRVANYCKLIAKGIGLSLHDIEIIEIASPLHDLGKIGITEEILHKPGQLTEEEWAVMQTHAQIGYDILNNSDREILKVAAIIAIQHHEFWNGNGYPNKLKGKEIHIFGRISAVADVFDALGSKRCYKDAWDIEKIIDYMLEQRGIQFDPEIIDWIMSNIDSMKQVRLAYPDTE